MTYQYPDKADQITLSLILGKQMDTASIGMAEDAIFASCEDLFRKHNFNALLDLGCGKGRLILKFSKYFKTVAALEPDTHRLEQARKILEANHIENVVYLGKTFEAADLQENCFDVVICNQVIQHIPTTSIGPMMQGIFRVLAQNGILVLTTTWSNQEEDYFIKSLAKKGQVRAAQINRNEFNELTSNDHGILPIHYFSKDTLHRYLSSFKKIEQRIFDDIFPDSMLDTFLFIGQKERA